MKVKKKNFILLFILVIITNYASKKTENIPLAVKNLIIPSGFDNEYAIAIKNGEKIEKKKPYLRIIGFEVKESFLKAIKETEFKLEEIIKSEFSKSNRFNLLAIESDIQAILKEQRKIGIEEFDRNTSDIKIGMLKIASYVLKGEITHSYPIIKQIGGYFSLKVSVGSSITLLNATTGEIVFTTNVISEKEEKLFVTAEGMIIKGPRNLTNRPLNLIRAQGSDIDLSPQYYDALYETLKKIRKELEEKFPMMGEVIEVKGKNIITTIDEGINNGDYIIIVRLGDYLKDSTGKIVGISKEAIGAAIITTIEKNTSIAKIVKARKNIKKGDIAITLVSENKF